MLRRMLAAFHDPIAYRLVLEMILPERETEKVNRQ